MCKYTVIGAVVTCIASLIIGNDGGTLQLAMILASFGFLVATVAVMYIFCRCPYCGKHIMLGVLTIKTCPSCRRNLMTGKKEKKSR